MNDIKGFFRNYRWLSNFYPLRTPIEETFDGIHLTYSTVEQAYQAAKTMNVAHRRNIMLAETPYEAKRMGNVVQLRSDWDAIKDDVMLDLVRKKFYRNPELKQKLIDTYPVALYEVNNWGDTYWGCDDFLEGDNRLGQILMQVRDEVRDQF